tara:strand:+ start:33 stop:578 length:546 start_codon:yes stop_codon:yes gene_type:complete
MKIFRIFFLYFLLIFNSSAEDREIELNKLFNELNTNNFSSAYEIEQKIWDIWITHPTNENLTSLLSRGTTFMNNELYGDAEIIFSAVIKKDPNWAEAWNKRATLFYLIGKYEDSQNDIDEVLKIEKRHFGALSGQALVQIKLKNYEKALKSYKEIEIIYPSMRSLKVMIPKIKELIINSTI